MLGTGSVGRRIEADDAAAAADLVGGELVVEAHFVRFGGDLVLNPAMGDMAESTLDLIVCGTADAITMSEAAASPAANGIGTRTDPERASPASPARASSPHSPRPTQASDAARDESALTIAVPLRVPRPIG